MAVILVTESAPDEIGADRFPHICFHGDVKAKSDSFWRHRRCSARGRGLSVRMNEGRANSLRVIVVEEVAVQYVP